MSRRVVVSVLLVGVVCGGIAAAVPFDRGAHGGHIQVAPQVVDDGTVVVDSVTVQSGGFLVIHQNREGKPGRTIGHAPLKPGISDDVAVELNEPLSGDGSVVLWAVVHNDGDGDGEFDPTKDPIRRTRGEIGGTQFPVRTRGGPALLLGINSRAQPSQGSVDLNRVALPDDGFVVVRQYSRAEPGDVVGVKPLPEGVHEGVTVRLDPAAYPDGRSYFRLQATLYVDNGDDRFDPNVDRPVEVGGRRVASAFPVEQTGPVDRTPTATATRTATTTETPDPTTTADRTVTRTRTSAERTPTDRATATRTPTPGTETAGTGTATTGTGTTPTATAGAGTTGGRPTSTGTVDWPDRGNESTTGGGSSAGSPGFGAGLALVALAAALLALSTRRE